MKAIKKKAGLLDDVKSKGQDFVSGVKNKLKSPSMDELRGRLKSHHVEQLRQEQGPIGRPGVPKDKLNDLAHRLYDEGEI